MARKLRTFKFRDGRRPTYPWDEWLDGSIWQLTRGEDFTTDPESMRSTAANAARRRGLAIRSSSEDGVVVIQAFHPNGEAT